MTLESQSEQNKEVAWDPVDPFDEQDSYFWVKIEHLARYMFAADYLRARKIHSVADIACGMGYGLVELEPIAAHIIGVDNSEEVLKIAKQRYARPNTQFVQCELDGSSNMLSTVLGTASLDSIICFETLEHLLHPANALTQFAQVLRPEGLLICSVPNVLSENRDAAGLPVNTYHKQFFSYGSFSRLLECHGFTVLYRIGQVWANTLFKRENQLLQSEIIPKGIGSYSCVNNPELLRLFARIIAYPTVEDVEGSYSIIVVAQKTR